MTHKDESYNPLHKAELIVQMAIVHWKGHLGPHPLPDGGIIVFFDQTKKKHSKGK